MLDHPITKSEFAALVGISPQAAGKLAKAGILADGADGATWVRAYAARLRAEAAGRTADDTGVSKARARALTASASRNELLTQIAARRLLDRDVIEAELAPLLRNTRDAILRVPDRIEAKLVDIQDHHALRRLLRGELETAMRGLVDRIKRKRKRKGRP